jgi:hypothetical protein
MHYQKSKTKKRKENETSPHRRPATTNFEGAREAHLPRCCLLGADPEDQYCLFNKGTSTESLVVVSIIIHIIALSGQLRYQSC